MKKLLHNAIIWTLIGLSSQQQKFPKNCGPIKSGIIDFSTDSGSSYKEQTGIEVQLIDNGDDHSIVIDGSYKGIMIIAMDTEEKKSVGSFSLSKLSLRKHRLLKCFLPRDSLRHLSDRDMKSGTNKFDWEGRCGPNIRFYIYTTTETSNSAQFYGSRDNPWLWNKLEIPCSQSTSFKAHLDEVVQLKINARSNFASNINKRQYPRSWNRTARPFSSGQKAQRGSSYAFTPWEAWGQCSAKCGTGTKTRRRKCASTTEPKKTVNYNLCGSGAVTDILDCESGDCPEWNDWGAWSSCSRTCGEGLTTRRRYCLFGGPCPGEKEEKKACNTNKCDRDQMKLICKDKYPYCNKWKLKGYCEDTFSTWMIANCRHTCGRCQKDLIVPECKDTYEMSCWRWKEDGKCESDTQQIRAFVRTKCKKSCGNCGFNE